MPWRRTKQGLVDGLKTVFGETFLSIPYARQSEKGSEWAELVELERSTPVFTEYQHGKEKYAGFWDATRQQDPGLTSGKSDRFVFLDICVPAKLKQYPNGLPVIIGFFNDGKCYSGDEIQNASIAAFWLQSVVITFNYRKELLRTDLYVASESCRMEQKIRNARVVLKWVHENIDNFDGNVCNINLLGCDSKAENVLRLIDEPSIRVFFEKIVLIQDSAAETEDSIETEQLLYPTSVVGGENETLSSQKFMPFNYKGRNCLLEKPIFVLTNKPLNIFLETCLGRLIQMLVFSDTTFRMFGTLPEVFVGFLENANSSLLRKKADALLSCGTQHLKFFIDLFFGAKGLFCSINTKNRVKFT